MIPGPGPSMLNVVITAALAFVATNIDDLFVLTMFFSQTGRGLQKWKIIAGQYLGFSALSAISLAGFLGGRVLSPAWMGLLGFVPVWIGLRRWFSRNKPVASLHAKTLSIAGVAAVTFANGGDNIGIYTPLFASCNLPRLVITMVIFQGLLLLWCFAADGISHHPAVAPVLTRYGHIIVPLVLVGLGINIIAGSGALRLVGL